MRPIKTISVIILLGFCGAVMAIVVLFLPSFNETLFTFFSWFFSFLFIVPILIVLLPPRFFTRIRNPVLGVFAMCFFFVVLINSVSPQNPAIKTTSLLIILLIAIIFSLSYRFFRELGLQRNGQQISKLYNLLSVASFFTVCGLCFLYSPLALVISSVFYFIITPTYFVQLIEKKKVNLFKQCIIIAIINAFHFGVLIKGYMLVCENMFNLSYLENTVLSLVSGSKNLIFPHLILYLLITNFICSSPFLYAIAKIFRKNIEISDN